MLRGSAVFLWALRLFKLWMFYDDIELDHTVYYLVPKVLLHVLCIIPPFMLQAHTGDILNDEDNLPTNNMTLMGLSLMFQSGCEVTAVACLIVWRIGPETAKIFAAPCKWYRKWEQSRITHLQ